MIIAGKMENAWVEDSTLVRHAEGAYRCLCCPGGRSPRGRGRSRNGGWLAGASRGGPAASKRYVKTNAPGGVPSKTGEGQGAVSRKVPPEGGSPGALFRGEKPLDLPRRTWDTRAVRWMLCVGRSAYE